MRNQRILWGRTLLQHCNIYGVLSVSAGGEEGGQGARVEACRPGAFLPRLKRGDVHHVPAATEEDVSHVLQTRMMVLRSTVSLLA